MFPVVMPGERRGSPHSPQLTHTHTHRGHQLGEVGRAGARCPSEPRAPRPAARQGGTPRHPQIPFSDPLQTGDRHQGGHGHRAEPPLLPPQPRQRGIRTGRAGGERGLAAPSRAGSPDTYSQSLEAPAAATYQHVPLHFSRLKHCLFLHFCRVCACVCCSPRVT